MPRVISGKAKGLKLISPKGNSTRPTLDRVKESVFNIIASLVHGSHVLDLFSGTGSLGIEALSRGAEKAIFVDLDSECCNIIKENLSKTRLGTSSKAAEVSKTNAFDIIVNLAQNRIRFDIIFVDPPYNSGLAKKALEIISENDIIKENVIIIVETAFNEVLGDIKYLSLVREKLYGSTKISFYRKLEWDEVKYKWGFTYAQVVLILLPMDMLT